MELTAAPAPWPPRAARAGVDGRAGSLLAVTRVGARSVVTRARAVAPLRLHAPRSPGHAAWVYQASLGGGFVGRDAIALEVEVGPGARLFLTSQASSKVYRGADSRARLDAAIGDGGVLVAWPDPVVCFAGARFDQRQRFRLAGAAGLLAVDSWTAGRVAHGERWAFDRLALRTELELDGALVLADAVVVSPAHGALAGRLAGAGALASVVVAGPGCAALGAAIARAVAARPVSAAPLIAASTWPWGSVVRIAAPDPAQLAAALHTLLAPALRELLGADPFTRKW